MVPMAPSSTRMRDFTRSRKADRVLARNAFTATVSGSADGLHSGPQAQQVADREDKICAIHRVEMKRRHPAIDEVDDLLGSDRRRDQLARCGVVIESMKSLGNPG